MPGLYMSALEELRDYIVPKSRETGFSETGFRGFSHSDNATYQDLPRWVPVNLIASPAAEPTESFGIGIHFHTLMICEVSLPATNC
jgi:hypothetical protein